MSVIRTETTLPHPPARVWRALTDPAELGRWLMPCDFRAELGAHFSFDAGQWGRIACEVTALEPEALLRYTWRNPPLDTVVTWRLEAVGEGTRLTMEHAGFDLADPMQRFAFENMDRGWQGILGRLAGALG